MRRQQILYIFVENVSNMKKNLLKIICAFAAIMSLTSCFGLLGSGGEECEISGDLWVVDSYRKRVDGVYDQTSGYELYGMIVAGDWTPGDMTVQYIRVPEAKSSIVLVKVDDVNISTNNSVLFMSSIVGGPWNVVYDTKKPNEVRLEMSYTHSGVTHNDFIVMKKTKSVKKGERIRIK